MVRKVGKQQLLIHQKHMPCFCTRSNWFFLSFVFTCQSIATCFQYGHKKELPLRAGPVPGSQGTVGPWAEVLWQGTAGVVFLLGRECLASLAAVCSRVVSYCCCLCFLCSARRRRDTAYFSSVNIRSNVRGPVPSAPGELGAGWASWLQVSATL